MKDADDFAKLAVALTPWRNQLVIVGGWAHRLYRQHPLAESPAYMPLTTKDADVAFASDERLSGNIQTALIEAGFKENLSGDHRPPVSQYTLGDEDSGFYAEFLTPLIGSGIKRGGKPDATLLKAGITAQKLRHLEVLLVNPWQISLATDKGGGAEETTTLLIPNPVSFIVQKVLIRHDRRPNKRAQDVLYMHDTLELFGGQLAALAVLWKEKVADTLTDRQKRELTDGVKDMFSAVNDVLRDAALIPQDRSLTPERMQALCAQAFGEILV
jgi:hypothetical protein